jgi:glycosyltransferase involved in cell wall biosynthesis
MRIAFDHQIFGWQAYGGISRYMYELARGLARHENNEVHVLSPLYINQYLKKDHSCFKTWGLPIPAIPRAGRLIRAANNFFVQGILAYLKPSIVHETYYANRRLAPKNSKVILSVYDMIHERFPSSFSSFDPTRDQKRAAVLRADHVICISKNTQKDLVELIGIDPDKTSVVPLGFELNSPKDLDCFAKLAMTEEKHKKHFLLYVGARNGYKNFEGLLKAIASSVFLKKEVELLCFGGGAFTAQEKKLALTLGLKLESLNQISGSDDLLASLYSQASAFVYPSLYEGFGIPPLEAMHFSCPVACSNTSSIPEVVGPAGAYFDPENNEEMAAILEQIVCNTELRSQLIKAGQEQLAKFSWARCASDTLKIYEEVLKCEP